MRTIILVTLFVSTYMIANCQFESLMLIDNNSGQTEYEVIFGMVENHSLINFRDVEGEHNEPPKPYYNLLQYGNDDSKSIYKFSRIAIRIYNVTENRLAKIEETGLKKVTLKIGAYVIDYELTDLDKKITDYYINVLELYNKKRTDGTYEYSFENDNQVSINLEFENTEDKKILIPKFKGKYYTPFSTYKSLNSNTRGFWIPSLLFSSNLKSDSTGVPFAALPIGVAYGWKKNTKSNIYYGVSIIGSWLIHSESELNNGVPESNNWSLANVSLGILFDINDVLYLGYSYGWDLREGQTDPGHMLVLGFGIKSLNFLKNSGSK